MAISEVLSGSGVVDHLLGDLAQVDLEAAVLELLLQGFDLRRVGALLALSELTRTTRDLHVRGWQRTSCLDRLRRRGRALRTTNARHRHALVSCEGWVSLDRFHVSSFGDPSNSDPPRSTGERWSQRNLEELFSKVVKRAPQTS